MNSILLQLRDGDLDLALPRYNQLGGQRQPHEFYDVEDIGHVAVQRFHALGRRFQIRFRNVDEVDNFPSLLYHIFEDIILRLRQNVSEFLEN